MEHPAKQDATITNCEFDVSKQPAPTDLIWKGQSGFGLSEKFDGSFLEAQILNNVGGTKTGYSVKEITNLGGQNPSSIATIDSGKKSITYIKVGVFTADVTLQHATKADKTFMGAKFQITKADSPKNLVWTGANGLSETFDENNKKFTEAQILNNVGGSKTGYSLKEITNLGGANSER